ncbi:MAG: hypothetical protein ACKVU0_13675 [Saprospiraceae bacterium]
MTHQTQKDNHGQPENFAPPPADYEHLICPTKTRIQIAAEYGIDPHTLKNWIKRDGLDVPPGDLSPKSQRLLYETYGTPPTPEGK